MKNKRLWISSSVFFILLKSEIFVIKFVVAFVTHSERVVCLIVVWTFVSKFQPPTFAITIFTHAFGVVSLVSVIAFRDQLLFVLHFSDDLRLNLDAEIQAFLFHGSTLIVTDYQTFIDFEIEVGWCLCRLDHFLSIFHDHDVAHLRIFHS